MSTSSSDLQGCEPVGVSAFEYPEINLMDLPQNWQQEPEPAAEAEEPAAATAEEVEEEEQEPRFSQEEVAQQAAQARTQGRQEGREEGLRAGIEQGVQQAKAEAQAQAKAAFDQELAGERSKIAAALEKFKHDRVRYYANVESELVQLSLAIAAKILHREAQVDPLLMAGLVKIALQRLEQGSKVTMRVPPEEVEMWNRNVESVGSGMDVAVVADDSVQPHDCILDTSLGTVQLGLEAQLKEVEQGFFDLLAHRPE